jgi:hypothetical protein
MIARALLLAAAVVAGCAKRDEKARPSGEPPAPVNAAERAQAVLACARYVEQICACAAAKPDDQALAEACQLDRSIPPALALAIQTAEHAETQKQDAVRARSQVQKLATTCLERTAKLPTLGCTGAAGSAAPPAAPPAGSAAPPAGSAAPPAGSAAPP